MIGRRFSLQLLHNHLLDLRAVCFSHYTPSPTEGTARGQKHVKVAEGLRVDDRFAHERVQISTMKRLPSTHLHSMRWMRRLASLYSSHTLFFSSCPSHPHHASTRNK